MIKRRLMVLLGAPLMAAAWACHHSAHTPPAATAPDSLKGIVSITGTSFEQQIVLRSNNTVTILSAGARDSMALSRMGGVEVLVVGSRSGKQFRVDRFTAVSVAGSRVVDGVIRDDRNRLVLETSNGRIPLGNPPVALRSLIGARVWINGPLDSGPNSFGVIVPPQ